MQPPEVRASPRLVIMLNTTMKKSTNIVKRKAGRPVEIPGGATEFVGLRLPSDLLRRIDGWAKQEKIDKRSEAVRELIERGLAGSQSSKRTSPKAAAKASDMAAHQIDKLANPAMPEEERRARKRRLLKGPQEFRDMRGDQPKPKK
jgi:hypothetical protein